MKDFKAAPVGHGISAVFYGVPNKVVRDNDYLKEVFLGALRKEEFFILETVTRKFEPQGFSAVALIAESHAAIHTFPEHNSTHLSISSCRSPESGRIAYNYFKEKIRHERVVLHEYHVPVDPNFKTS